MAHGLRRKLSICIHGSRGMRRMTDYVVMDRKMMKDVLHVTMKRGAGCDVSDYFLLLTKL